MKKEKGSPVISSAKYLQYLINWPDYRKTFTTEQIGKIKCLAGKTFFNIDVDGKMHPCSVMVGRTDALNILDNDITEALKKLAMKCQDLAVRVV